MHIKARSSGFTLVEVAIVLVITGLLIGGILRGQELVSQARAKSLVNDFSGVAAATLAYRDRYKAWPGDDENADTRWSTFSALRGNGNGVVEGNYNDMPSGPLTVNLATGAGESANFWWHLRISGFVFGPISGPLAAEIPTTAAGGLLGVQWGSGLTNFFPGLMACASGLTDRMVQTIDAQLDDLRPGAGQIRAVKQNSGNGNPTLDGSQTSSAPPADYDETGARWVACRQL